MRIGAKKTCTQAIAQALGAKIYCDPRKTAILRCQADKELHTLLTADPAKANVHVLPLGTVTTDNLKSYLQRFKGTFSRVIGFRPTGWTCVVQLQCLLLVDFFTVTLRHRAVILMPPFSPSSPVANCDISLTQISSPRKSHHITSRYLGCLIRSIARSSSSLALPCHATGVE